VQIAALGAHTLILEDGHRLPDCSLPALSEKDRVGQGNSISDDDEGREALDAIHAPICEPIAHLGRTS
jgi:hypothetical protein